MNWYMLVLRVVHVGFGVFWVGTLFFLVFFLEPTVREAGPDAAKVMQGLVRRRLMNVVPIAAALTVLSGILLIERVSGGFQSEWLRSSTGMALSIGGGAAIVAFGLGMLGMRPAQMRSMRLAAAMPGMTDPAERDRTSREIQALRTRARTAGRWIALFLMIAVVAMASGRYV